jgi:hypothetical protein
MYEIFGRRKPSESFTRLKQEKRKEIRGHYFTVKTIGSV